MTELENKISELKKIVITDKKFLYRNALMMSGWVIEKPYFGTLKNNIEICFFKIYQLGVNRKRPYMFLCNTRNKKLIAEIKAQENVFGINILGSLPPFTKGEINVVDGTLSYSIEGLKL